MWKLTSTSTNDSWTLWIEPRLSLFVFVVLLPCCLCQRLLTVFPCSDDRTLHWLKVSTHPMLHAHVSSVVLIAVSPRHLHSFLLPHFHLSDQFAVPTARQLQLPRCGGQIPCALPLRTLAPWSRTVLPQIERFGGALLKNSQDAPGTKFRFGKEMAISRRYIQKGEPHERNPFAPKFEERTPEETSRQEEARKAAWNLARKIHKLQAEDKAMFYSPIEKRHRC